MLIGTSTGVMANVDNIQERLLELKNFYSTTLSPLNFSVASIFIDSYATDAVFIEHYRADQTGAMEMVSKVVDGYVSSTLKSARGWIYQGVSAPAPSIRQKWTNSCGPTSALQVITSYGMANINDHDSIASAMGVSQFGSFTPSADALAYQINKYTAKGYAYINASALTRSTFKQLIQSSLEDDAPVILQSKPSLLPYYTSANTGGHYIVGQELNIVNNTLVLNDCHYDNRYFGIHTVSLSSAFNSITNLTNNGYTTGHLIYKP